MCLTTDTSISHESVCPLSAPEKECAETVFPDFTVQKQKQRCDEVKQQACYILCVIHVQSLCRESKKKTSCDSFMKS